MLQNVLRRAQASRPVDGRSAADGATLKNDHGQIGGRPVSPLLVQLGEHVALAHVEVFARVVATFFQHHDFGTGARQCSGGDGPPGSGANDADIGFDLLAGRQRLFDRLLLAVEVIAILGLVYLAFNGANLVRELNDEVAAALELPTLTPTPLITAVVLPSGHTPPTSPGGARPNDAEIPEHLRPLVQSLPSFDLPTPSPEQAVRIQIPAIGVDHPIVQWDGWEQLKKGVGQHLGTANPGQISNLVLSAHNDIFGEIFRFLDQLSPGDEIVIFTNIRAYTYVITNTLIVEPTFVQVMDPTSYSAVTLISCYPYLIDTERIVIQANLVDG